MSGHHGQAASQRPRLAHLTTVDMSLALLLATELEVDVETGHEVFGLSAPGPYVGRVQEGGVTHVAVPSLTRSWSPRRDLAAFRELHATIRALDLDILHTHNPKTGVMGRIAGRLAGVPVVVNTCHGLWARPEDSVTKKAFVYGLEGLAARFSDYELFQNADDRRTLRPALKRGRSRVVGNGVDLVRFGPDPEGRRRVRAELGVDADEILVGSIGRRVREKGLAEFAHAATVLADRATFVWVGPEDDTDAGAGSARAHGIRFVDERTDMPAVYSALDVFVLASYREGFSRAAMEAAACGVPMVLTDIRGCREIGEDGVHVSLVPAHDGRALAQTIEELLGDPKRRARLGAAARKRALDAFDQRRVARLSLEAYAAVARAKGRDAAAPPGRLTSLHVLPLDRDRGAQVFAGRLRDDLNAQGDQRHAVVTLFTGPDAAAAADLKLDLPRGLLARLGLDPRAAFRLRREVHRLRPDVVVAHGGEALKYVVVARPKAATIYKRTGLSSAEVTRASRIHLYRALSRRVTHIVGVSQALLDQSHVLMGVPRDKLSLIPNGRDPDTYHPPGEGEPRLAPPSVLFLGHLEAGKRPELFLNVVEVLRSRSVPFQAMVAGDGPLRSSLRQRAATLGVEMLGNCTNVPDLLRTASVLLFTSEPASEGMPGVLIEAGLSGLPVVSTQAAGVTDIVLHGQTGFVVASSSATELADRVEQLLKDVELRTRLGDAARRRCAEAYTLSAATRQWHDLIQRIALTTPRGTSGRFRAALSCEPATTGTNSEQ